MTYLIRKLAPRWYWKRRLARYRKAPAPRPTWDDLRAADAWHRVEILNGNR